MGDPKELCAKCSAIDLKGLLSREKTPSSIGRLSEYRDENCPFCSLIARGISLEWGDDASVQTLREAKDPTPELFIQSRSPLSVIENRRKKYPQPRIVIAINHRPPNVELNRAVVREIDRDSHHIIAEIESLPKDTGNGGDWLIRQPVNKDLDIALVKRWIDECLGHKTCKPPKSLAVGKLFDSENGFRLIDVKQQCLVQKFEPVEYVALSYVWGKITTALRTSTENVKYLSEPNSLSPAGVESLADGTLPQTIIDAIDLVQRAGFTYLWIDTLCIIQNDPKDKGRLISSMDDVYDGATFTIVACAGIDASAGLPGISPRAGIPIQPVEIASKSETLSLQLCPATLSEQARKSIWYTRGWTFQEQCLSRRCLYFTSNEVFFNCRQEQFREAYSLRPDSEDAEIEVRTGPPWWGVKLRKDPDPTPYRYLGQVSRTNDIHEYQRAVQDYNRKNLSFQNDGLNAFEGIFNRYNLDSPELSNPQTQGMPSKYLFQALLWFPSDGSRKREEAITFPTDSVSFSTWSWASWIGPVDFFFADSLWLSRNISHATIKRVPFYTTITSWNFGDSSSRYWSHDVWEAAGTEKKTQDVSRMEKYLKEQAGLDIQKLLTEPKFEKDSLAIGQLGFFGAYVPVQEGLITRVDGRLARDLVICGHKGQFKFDIDTQERVDELVVVIANDTITKPSDSISILLGLATQDGVSVRVGIGYIYYSRDLDVPRPQWNYKQFKLR